MPHFHAIAAMSENRVIGDHGKIPWHLPEDFRWFKHKTMGGTLIMGRKTFESIGKPLPGRKTIVLTHQAVFVDDVEICTDATMLIQRFSDEQAVRPEWGEHIHMPETATSEPFRPPWICGGAQVYQRFLPECMKLYLTRIKSTVPGDVFFPPFENDFSLSQVIHETENFRVERWLRNGYTTYTSHESWPFPPSS